MIFLNVVCELSLLSIVLLNRTDSIAQTMQELEINLFYVRFALYLMLINKLVRFFLNKVKILLLDFCRNVCSVIYNTSIQTHSLKYTLNNIIYTFTFLQ